MEKILILGNHPLAEDLIRQYRERGDEVDHLQELVTKNVSINHYDEICLLTGMTDGKKEESDQRTIAFLNHLVADYDLEQNGGRKLVGHLLVRSQQTLRMLQTTDCFEAIRQKIDVYPFTMDEVWSRKLMLDYEPITFQSEKYVHLVLFGMGKMAEMVAVHTALVAHFPNYVRNHSLRTRITMIDEQAEHRSQVIIKDYQHLFDNSYYRMVKPSGKMDESTSHKPKYAGTREDFVDVEWEFMETPNRHDVLHEKLQMWATDEKQLLTVVMADGDGNKNMDMALHLPETLFRQHIPIYIYSQRELNIADCQNIRIFGLMDRGYDISLPLVGIAKNVNYFYNRCYEEKIVPGTRHRLEEMHDAVEIDKEERDRFWAGLSNEKRMASIYSAMTVETKLRSLGLEKSGEKLCNMPRKDMEIMAQVEHNRWSVAQLILGFRPCTDEEQKVIEADINQKDDFKRKKIHYDLRAYNDLRPDKTGMSVKVYDLCLCYCLPQLMIVPN